MINKNMSLWLDAFTTDPSAVKPITGKQYQGNSPKPYWIIKRATEIFGACGEGWGVEVKSEGFHRMTDTDVMHTAVVVVWYMRDGKRCHVEQMGQTKACYQAGSGKMMVDEDAGKKSVTDGMVKALSMIGFAGDIFSGRWDDSKYVEEAAAITRARENPKITAEQVATLTALATELKIDMPAFLAYGKVSSLADIQAEHYDGAVKMMEKKRAK
jgi:hypothetical protein